MGRKGQFEGREGTTDRDERVRGEIVNEIVPSGTDLRVRKGSSSEKSRRWERDVDGLRS